MSFESNTRRILILIGGHFATAPRPQKEAAAARRAGFDVSVRGVWSSSDLADEDKHLANLMDVDFAPVVDFRSKSLREGFIKFKQRLARELFRRSNIVTPRAFGYCGPEMLREAVSLSPLLTIVHSEAGLWVGMHLLRRGLRLIVDFEDWFSEDLAERDRISRPHFAIKGFERKLLQAAAACFTTTDAMARALAIDAGTTRLPITIPNCFPASAAPAVSVAGDKSPISFYWFSQTIGPDRGLETVAKALAKLHGDWRLNLRGNLRSYSSWFAETFPEQIRDRIRVEPTVPNSDLPRLTAENHVGLALEVPFCRSRDLTATNKIFEYLRCGLAVIATNTQGQLEVMSKCPAAGVVVRSRDEMALANAMQLYIDDRDALNAARLASRSAGENTWCWERF